VRFEMPVRHLLVWLVAGAACWVLIAVAALVAPQALLALGALLILPWLRRPEIHTAAGIESGSVEPVLLRAPVVESAAVAEARDDALVLVAQSA
jgi:hypothetical protein